VQVFFTIFNPESAPSDGWAEKKPLQREKGIKNAAGTGFGQRILKSSGSQLTVPFFRCA
jgi:hypothetical protein